MTNVRCNIAIKIITTIISSIACAMATGTLIQIFLNSMGFSASQIYLHTSINQAVQLSVNVACAKFGDRGNFFRRFALTGIAHGLTFLLYIPMCIRGQADLVAYLLLLSIGVASSLFACLNGLLTYKLPYLIFRTEDYGVVTAVCGVLSSAISIGMGVVMAALAAQYTYKVIMPWLFSLAAGLMLTGGILQLRFRPLIDPATVQDDRPRKKLDIDAVWQVLRQPLFYQLAIPNFFRGFAGGMTGVLAVVAAADLGYSEQTTTSLISVLAAANMLACVAFGALSRCMNSRYMVFVSGLSFLCMPFLLIPDSPALFLCLAAVLTFGSRIEMEAVPALLLRAVPGRIAGTYNAYRLTLNSAGSLVAISLASVVPSSVMLPMAMCFQLISGMSYCFLPIMRRLLPIKR